MNRKTGLWLLSLILAANLPPARGAAADPVKLTETQISIPTYLLGEPEPNPIFYSNRGSQGAQGRVYPYPLYDRLTDVKSNKLYRIVYLENEYVRVGILPEVGGRVLEAVDKSNDYNFVYRQHVIKPALIGLIGAWISGGVEWNIPHHHRATSALPVQYHCEENSDGSQTVWVGELEVRDRMRWAVGYTLRPGRSYLECSVRIVNRTPYVHTMLCFANVAVHVNDSYQVLYPPHTRFVTFHSKHEFTTWPIATTRYAGADFTRGVDVSWYSNHITANSMFAWNYQDDFFAGYDHGRHAGIISFADHHIIPGKKFWTWGTGARGRMWDKILTDSDGPYIELMTGAYSDNQPDYSWLQPFETKTFKMYWYPFRDIENVKNANLDAALNLDLTTNRTARLGFCTTAAYPAATAELRRGTNILFEQTIAISPGKPFVKEIPLPPALPESQLRAALLVDGKELIAYSPVQLEPAKMPEPVKDPPPPKEIPTTEELYLAGQRIEQFHSANLRPEPYWEEALRRDPGDARVNTAWAIRLLKAAQFAEAEQHLRKAIERLTRNYTSPKDGEPFYYLGLALEGQAWVESCPPSNYDAAFDAFYKATWSQAWRGPAYFALAELAARRGDLSAALDYAERSLDANALNIRALNLKAALLRHLDRTDDALAVLRTAASKVDPLDTRLAAERWRAGDGQALNELAAALREFPSTGLQTAVEYARTGFWQDGVALLELMVESAPHRKASPLAWYCLGEFHERLGHAAKAAECRRLAAEASPEYVFPFQWEIIPVLRHAMAANPQDARAPYYLGNLLCDGQPEQAVACWQKAEELDPSFAIVHRNLAWAYSHQEESNDPKPDATARAIGELEKAVAAPNRYALHFTELDELYAATGVSPEKRLSLLRQNQSVVSQRDDALSREIGLLVFAGDYDRAIQLMSGRRFAVWEGGSLEVAQHWVNAHLLRGRRQLQQGQAAAALADFESARTIPDNLPNDSDGNSRAAEIGYWVGLAHDRLGESAKAASAWSAAVAALDNNSSKNGRHVSDRLVQAYYGARAQQKLGQAVEAATVLKDLLLTAQKALETPGTLERPRGRRRYGSEPALAHYLAGLSELGLGQPDQAKAQLQLALQSAPDLLGAKVELEGLGPN